MPRDVVLLPWSSDLTKEKIIIYMSAAAKLASSILPHGLGGCHRTTSSPSPSPWVVQSRTHPCLPFQFSTFRPELCRMRRPEIGSSRESRIWRWISHISGSNGQALSNCDGFCGQVVSDRVEKCHQEVPHRSRLMSFRYPQLLPESSRQAMEPGWTPGLVIYLFGPSVKAPNLRSRSRSASLRDRAASQTYIVSLWGHWLAIMPRSAKAWLTTAFAHQG